MPKPLIADKPYPDVSRLSHDPVSVRIISPAYAASSSELNATLQYVYHSMAFACGGDAQRAGLLKSIAVAEMMHLELLGKALTYMGAQPVYTSQPPARFNFYSTKFVAYSRNGKEMIEDDIMGEKYAISGYERMACRLKNATVKELVLRITEDERLHLEALKKSLSELTC